MQENTHQHLCKACQQVFHSSPDLAHEDCPHCGIPLAATASAIPNSAQTEESSAKRLPRKKSKGISNRTALLISTLTCLLCASLLYYAFHLRDQSPDSSSAERDQEQEQTPYNKRAEQEMKLALKRLYPFLAATTAGEKSSYVVDGLKQTPALHRYYSNNLRLQFPNGLEIIAYAFHAGDTHHRLEMLISDKDRGYHEIVMWREANDNAQWQLDWDHFVRHDSLLWSRFINEPHQDLQGTFRVYLRQHSVESKDQEDIAVTLYDADRQSGRRGTPSDEIIVAPDHPLYRSLQEIINTPNPDTDHTVMRAFDAPALRRVTAELGYETYTDQYNKQRLRLQLIDILDSHWMARQPEQNKMAKPITPKLKTD